MHSYLSAHLHFKYSFHYFHFLLIYFLTHYCSAFSHFCNFNLLWQITHTHTYTQNKCKKSKNFYRFMQNLNIQNSVCTFYNFLVEMIYFLQDKVFITEMLRYTNPFYYKECCILVLESIFWSWQRWEENKWYESKVTKCTYSWMILPKSKIFKRVHSAN